MTTRELDPDSLPLETIRNIDKVCDRFERDWYPDQSLDIRSYVEDQPISIRPLLVCELVRLDLQCAKQHGTQREDEEYCHWFPEHRALVVGVLEGYRQENLGTDTNTEFDDTSRGTPTELDGEVTVEGRPERYRLIKELGRGAFGIVYLADDTSLNRQVAIKVAKNNDAGDGSGRRTLPHEARMAAKLGHTAIVTVHDVGCDENDVPYIVMEYVQGRSLKSELEKGRLEPTRAAKLLWRIADALDHAHQAGIVHRDLKPANILLNEEGLPLITDFGLAVDDFHQCLGDGELAGTFAYMPPEQVRGESQAIDNRCDIWSFGVIMYEMLTGHRPFRATSRKEQFEQILIHQPVPPRSVSRLIPKQLERICLNCLAKNPTDRYPTAAGVARELLQFNEGPQPILKVPLWWLAAALSSIVILGLLLAYYTEVLNLRRSHSAPTTVTDELLVPSEAKATPGVELAPFSLVGREQQYRTLAAAIENAIDGDVIDVCDDGPFHSGPMIIDNKPLTIRSARGKQPVIVLTDINAKALLKTNASLTLDGLELRRKSNMQRPRIPKPSIIACQRAKLNVSNCRLVLDATRHNVCLLANSCSEVEVRNCEIYHTNGAGVHWDIGADGNLLVENCVFHGATTLLLRPRSEYRASVRLRRNSIIATEDGILLTQANFNRERDATTPMSRRIYIEATRNVFQVGTLMKQFVRAGEENLSLTRSLTELVQWQDQQCIFDVRGHYLLHTRMGLGHLLAEVSTAAQWANLWQMENVQSWDGIVSFHAVSIDGEGHSSFTAKSFQLRSRELVSTTQTDDVRQALGANLQFVGPGSLLRHESPAP